MNNRAMLFPIYANWAEKIFDGTKDFDYRGKLPKYLVKGMKIYLYETIGTKKKATGDLAIELRNKKGKGMNVINGFYYEGHGAVVGEFTVKDIWLLSPEIIIHEGVEYVEFDNLTTSSYMKPLIEMKPCGYDLHKWAIEITNVIKYDKPIPKEDFINYNKAVNLKKEVEEDCEAICEYCIYTDFGQTKVNTGPHNLCEGVNCEEATQNYLDDEANVKSPPQAPIYVVERAV